jgi:hypothetical protein
MVQQSTASQVEVDPRTDKPLGSSFLSEETLERAAKGNNVEKLKLKKDGTSAFMDVYEFAAKIRAGELTWEEIEKDDLESVSVSFAFVSSRLEMLLSRDVDWFVAINVVCMYVLNDAFLRSLPCRLVCFCISHLLFQCFNV